MDEPQIPDPHHAEVAECLLAGTVTPFLGVGVNLCEGLARDARLPTGLELAETLAQTYRYPIPKCKCLDLPRVSQFANVMRGPGPLYVTLRSIFIKVYQPTRVHRFLAEVPALLRRQEPRPPYQVIVTTNYDDVLESAFRAAGEPFDLVSYITVGEHRGWFRHTAPDGTVRLIENGNEYSAVNPRERTVILKIHGAIDRADPGQDSYVVTEDDYIQYLARPETLTNLLPVQVAATLRNSHLLFLGYSLQDWNLRVLLHRIAASGLYWNSWAVQLKPSGADAETLWRFQRTFWNKRNVELIGADLGEYIDTLRRHL